MWWGEGESEGEDGCAGVRVKVGVLWLIVFHWDCPALQTTSGRLISSTFQQIPAPWVRKTGSRRSCACQSVCGLLWAPTPSWVEDNGTVIFLQYLIRRQYSIYPSHSFLSLPSPLPSLPPLPSPSLPPLHPSSLSSFPFTSLPLPDQGRTQLLSG